MPFNLHFLRQHYMLLGLLLATGLLSCLPILNAYFVIGAEWRGVPQSYGDEILYINQIHEVLDGYFWYGNQYLYEHREGPPLVVFAGHWLAALPALFGMPFLVLLMFNFFLWSMIFAWLGYWLLRELSVTKLFAALGSLMAYLSVYGLMLRPTSRQEVYPFFALFYIALIRLCKKPDDTKSVLFLGVATGATFYAFSYLWQTAIITLGLVFLYALARSEWPLWRAIVKASCLGGLIGAPQLLYMLYLSQTVPYFLESLSRFGLVNTHLPMAEVLYSGGWIGILLLAVGIVWWCGRKECYETVFTHVGVFVVATGLGLWIMQGSNLITGKLLETGEHIRPFIGPWLAFAGMAFFVYAWQRRLNFSFFTKIILCALSLLTLFGWIVFVKIYFYPYINVQHNREAWIEQQSYAAPLQWLDQVEAESVVVWTDPEHPLGLHIPSLSKHYVLFEQAAIFTLTPNAEIQERYLVANYFKDISTSSLQAKLSYYVGRQDAFHRAKSIERGIKLCRIIYFYNGGENCGTPPTSVDLFGAQFFADLEYKFTTDIRPNIAQYLKKYHVSYSIKDTRLNATMLPENLGGTRVWSDGRYEIYKFTQ